MSTRLLLIIGVVLLILAIVVGVYVSLILDVLIALVAGWFFGKAIINHLTL